MVLTQLVSLFEVSYQHAFRVREDLFFCSFNCLASIFDIQLAEYFPHVILDGALCKVQFIRELPVCSMFRKEDQYLLLAPGQIVSLHIVLELVAVLHFNPSCSITKRPFLLILYPLHNSTGFTYFLPTISRMTFSAKSSIVMMYSIQEG